MKFREVFRYEVETQLRGRSTWFFAAVLFVIAFSINLDDGAVSVGAHANAPVRLALLTLLLSMLALPVSAAIFGRAAVRDVQAEMDPLLFTAPLRKIDYLGGRFLAALVVNAVVLLAIPAGFALPPLIAFLEPSLGGFRVDPAAFGPFRVGAYVQPYLLLMVPNLVLTGAVLFTAGVLTRQTIPVYLAAIGVFFSYMVTLGVMEDASGPAVSLIGLHGYHALSDLTRYWTVAEQNTRLIGFPSALLLNRMIWLAVSAGVIAMLHRAFRFAHHDGGGRRRGRRSAVIEADPGRSGPVVVPRVAGTFHLRTTVRQTLAMTRRALAEVVASRWFVVVLVACVLLTMLWGWNAGDTVFDTSTWPVSLLMVETVLSGRILLLPYLLITLYAGELVWQEREAGVAEIADAAPVPDGAVLLGRFLALVVMIVMFQAAFMAGGILIQALQGYYDFEIGLYVRVVFGLNLADYLLLAALAMTIHIIVNNKYLGHMVVVLAIVFTTVAGGIGIRHHLLVYGTDPGWTYSDMNGFGPFIGPFVWFKLYWAAWALLLAVFATLFLVRGREPGGRRRFVLARTRFRGPVARAAAVAIALVLVLGGFIFYNTNILNDYRTADEAGVLSAEYEKRYGRYEDAAQPSITAVELRTEIHPDEPAVDMRGTYHMVNRTTEPIDSVHVFDLPPIRVNSISLDLASSPVLVDQEVGYRIFALDRPLQPDDSLQLAFDVSFRPRGFTNSALQTDVVRNGAYFNRSWLPFIGYQPGFELPGEETRHRFGLGRRPPMPGPDDAEAQRYRSGEGLEDRIDIETLIGTAADQIAVTPGVLRRSWTENGRRYFHYETELPTSFGATVFSGRYAVLEDRWKDVTLQIFHHPGHDRDLHRMVRGMKASLEYFSEVFGPYPNSLLRIVEFPRYGGFGHAHPHTIAFAEDAFLSRVREGQVDQPFYGTVHEVAHQWWGGQARGAPVRGNRFLSESLANYSAMMVVEKTSGPEVARRVYDFHMDLYLRGRSRVSGEVPVLEVTDQSYIAYRKGAIAMYTLRDHIGDERVNMALRRYLERFRERPGSATSLDLLGELRTVTPDSMQYLLTDWFETVTLWDVRTGRVVVEPTGTGEYVVTMDVVAKKMRADREGNETEVPMDDLVEIGVFVPGAGNRPGEPLHLERHRIRSGEQTIRIIVSREPARAGIDPFDKLIDRKRSDNVIAVEIVKG